MEEERWLGRKKEEKEERRSKEGRGKRGMKERRVGEHVCMQRHYGCHECLGGPCMNAEETFASTESVKWN